MINLSKFTPKSLAGMALVVSAAALSVGCSTTTTVAKTDGTRLITATGDSRAEVLDNVKDQAAEVCEDHDFESFEVVDQKLLLPGEDGSKQAAADKTIENAQMNEDTDIEALAPESDEYQVTWLIRCK